MNPLTDVELEVLFAPLLGAPRIALAVSGGRDSLALLAAIERWRKRGPRRPDVLVLTVDHRLRPGSTREARAVAALAEAHGVAARVLTWRGARPTSGVEAAAREMRYRLLVIAAREAGATHLVTAHHQEDQAETFLMRLARGSGVFGLAAMRSEVRTGGLTLLRPFLAVPRARLAATTDAADLATAAVDDPMNADERFMRARVRALLPRLAAEGLDGKRLAASARRMAAAATVIDTEATALLAAAVTTDALAIATLDAPAFAAAPSDVRLRALTRLLFAIGGGDYPPRGERLTALADVVTGFARAPARGARLKRTLAGVLVEARGQQLLLYRERGRTRLPTLAIAPGIETIWDHRFRVSVAAEAPSGLTLSALGEEGRRAIEGRPEGIPAAAVAALPAVRRRSNVVAIPALGLGDARVLAAVVVRTIVGEQLREPPPLFPDFAAP